MHRWEDESITHYFHRVYKDSQHSFIPSLLDVRLCEPWTHIEIILDSCHKSIETDKKYCQLRYSDIILRCTSTMDWEII